MKSTIDGRRGQKGVKNGVKCLFSTIMFTKPLVTVQNLVLWGIHHFGREMGRYILPFCTIGMDLLAKKGLFGSSILSMNVILVFLCNSYQVNYQTFKNINYPNWSSLSENIEKNNNRPRSFFLP